MRANPKSQSKETVAEIHPVRFDLIYRILLKRIAAGYTRGELSFFLGFGLKYWERIENFSRCCDLNVADLLCLADVFGCPLTDLCLDVPAGTGSKPIRIHLLEHPNKYHIHYEAYQLAGNAEPVLLYKLREDQSKIYAQSYPDSEQKATGIITVLFENGFFDTPKDTVEIFKECTKQNGEAIKPRFIEKALKAYLLPQKARGLTKQGESRYDFLAKVYQAAHENEKK